MKTTAKKLKPTGIKIKIVERKPDPTGRLADAISAVRELNTAELKKLEVYLEQGRDTKSMRDARDAIRKLPKDVKKTISALFFAHTGALYPDGPTDQEEISRTHDDLYSVLDHEEYSLYSRGDDPDLDAMLESGSVA